ncbi:uncharacterized protein LOC119109466 [Pollicipes pollicipes]|uniref:uncharacterized protein LOC119109459 n=1 Tax=Pollicipes pollicipes TaxID=41117 RepID=UPI001884C942|nr:uncharacterized protein LOC119109459 [Pollicipes pollicipes]XP_037088980.1 uncharacterized protein LOC119109466 [Pollicipes pollicipes]XP_037088981.1 uncharacterized protein LOC119109466 [Pollicipes pollicipes]XP_037088982.1 uncharacterized protein LOC119109466 [Pollicipes pollicipes]
MSSLMTQVWVGATGGIKNEMTPVLGLSGPSDRSFLPAYMSAIDELSSGCRDVTTAVFNRIYLRNGRTFKLTFMALLRQYYGADIKTFSSEARAAAQINADVARVTANRITDLISAHALRESGLVSV